MDALGIVDNNQNLRIMDTNNKIVGGYGLGLIIIFILFLTIILSASYMGVFKGFEPYQQLIAAMLSVAATGVITALLLIFQRKQQEELNEKQRKFEEESTQAQREFQEKLTSEQRTFEVEQKEKEKERLQETKVFEEKLRIYQDFLHKLCDVVKDQKITREEEIELQFQISYIAMHTKSSTIKIISDNIKEIIISLKKEEDDANNMLGRLFNIADEFHKELYDDENSVLVGPDREDTIENFRSILIGKEDVQEYEDDEKQRIIDRYNKKIESKMELTVPERLKYLKAKINSNGADSCKLFYGGKLLNYEFYTKTNKEGKFVKTLDRIAIDLLLEGNDYVIRVGTRKNDPEIIKKMANAFDDRFMPGDTELTGPHWHVHAKFTQETPNDEIVEDMNDLLMRINNYRNG